MKAKTFLYTALLLAAVSGCTITDGTEQVNRPYTPEECPYPIYPAAEVPTMNLPLEARCKNYNGGSCVCASTITALRWQGQDELADKVREICSGGQSSGSLHEKLERLGIRYAATTSGDPAFLDWACRTRRCSGITFFGNHYINIVYLDQEKAILLDNNRVNDLITMPRAEFLRRWKDQYGGWATALVYSPAPPLAFVPPRK